MFLWVLEQVNISRRKWWFWARYLTWDTVYLVNASDRRAFFSIFLSFVWRCVSWCLLKEEGSGFMAFYLYPSVVINSGWLPVSTAACSCVWICTCIWVAPQKAEWHVTPGLLRGSKDKQFSTKYSAVAWCSGLIFSEVRLCSVPSPPMAAIGASITLISAHLQKRRKGRRCKHCINENLCSYLDPDLTCRKSGQQSEADGVKKKAHSA